MLEGCSYASGLGELRTVLRGLSLLKTFEKGGSKLVSSQMLKQFDNSLYFGKPSGTFISPSDEIDNLLSQGLNRVQIAEKLGIDDPLFLKGDLTRIDITPKALKELNLRLPTGKEAGANSLFVPGGKTSGGISEGVVNGVPKKGPGVSIILIN